MVKLFVSGFPLDITEMELAMLIGRHGDLDTIKIVRDKKTRKCKGYAFVEMKDRDGADNAVEFLDGTMHGDKALTVKITEEPPVKSTPQHRTQPAAYQKVGKFMGDEKKKRPRKSL